MNRDKQILECLNRVKILKASIEQQLELLNEVQIELECLQSERKRPLFEDWVSL